MERLIREVLGSKVLDFEIDEEGNVVSGDLDALNDKLTKTKTDRDGWIIDGGEADVAVKAPDNIEMNSIVDYLLEDAGVKLVMKSRKIKHKIQVSDYKLDKGVHKFTLNYV
jgi:hypothetical protein